jgi:hypothetical protein
MNTPDTLAILVTQDTGQRQTKHTKKITQKTIKIGHTELTKKKPGSTHVLAKLNSYCF